MLHKSAGERPKNKPRGRPFSKGHRQGEPKVDILASERPSERNEGGTVIDSQVTAGAGFPAPVDLSQIPNLINDTINHAIKECLDTPKTEAKTDDSKDLETIESIEFKNGENTLSIRFSKRHNRMFRIQIYLNDESEIRPVTYTGATTGYAFWKLLKGAMKK